MAQADTEVTRAKTSDNPELPQARREALYKKYGGTTLGRQELDAEIIEDVAGALWKRDLIAYADPPRRQHGDSIVLNMARIVVAIDPAVTSGDDADETGIVVAGVSDIDGRGHVLADLSGRMTPLEWAQAAVDAYDRFSADRIVAEVNNGGDMVETVIRTKRANLPVSKVHASKGKKTRAEPVAALYEQHRVSHAEPFPDLEDQMCSYTGAPNEDSPDRMDALVWAMTNLMLESAWQSASDVAVA
jgi:predicted phage terminase large subunit-like protein